MGEVWFGGGLDGLGGEFVWVVYWIFLLFGGWLCMFCMYNVREWGGWWWLRGLDGVDLGMWMGVVIWYCCFWFGYCLVVVCFFLCFLCDGRDGCELWVVREDLRRNVYWEIIDYSKVELMMMFVSYLWYKFENIKYLLLLLLWLYK